ncbi:MULTISPECIES: nucleoside triphosphate pyrophosphatase [unclassified Dietzia]|uniref:Maf family protein n=2 Tax=Dietzia TaxID=37914 RepID=UPI000D21E07F|nr:MULTISPECIES: Maf family protein [unclassified Dietzia]AVZ38849.1 septum formation inhibitor Maf [Dietzia sp. JS16-p6b]MBB1023574.1 septum formation inhibitor Maf [Dietzia sp. DQ12-76]QGW23969.1 Maf-like protein [Dietzia sp. DQ12-45-1b]
MIRVVLASASPSRLRILQQAGVDPLIRHPQVDEDALQAALAEGTPHVRVVEELARAKAQDVLDREGESLADEARGAGADTLVVVGCDSMLLVDGRLEGKPHTYERAMARWQKMRGRHGVLITGHAVVLADLTGDGPLVVTGRATDTSDTTVHFGAPSDSDLDVYLRTGEPLECAGAFTIESLGGWFIDRIDGDPSSVIGLSLPLLRRLLEDAGIHAHQVWRPELRA